MSIYPTEDGFKDERELPEEYVNHTNDDLACERCGSFDLIYLGIEDGLGGFGEDICDVFECENCGHHQVGECG